MRNARCGYNMRAKCEVRIRDPLEKLIGLSVATYFYRSTDILLMERKDIKLRWSGREGIFKQHLIRIPF
jgi:hypothetical protein